MTGRAGDGGAWILLLFTVTQTCAAPLTPALPGLAQPGQPVSKTSLGSWPTEIPALRRTLTPFGVRLYF